MEYVSFEDIVNIWISSKLKKETNIDEELVQRYRLKLK